jgi:hypothetical protein
MSNIHNKNIKTPELRSSIVEPLLVSCINGVTNHELESAIQTIDLLRN